MKTKDEIEYMRQGGRKLRHILDKIIKEVKPGVTGKMIDEQARKLISRAGGKPSFKMVPNYRWATCVCTNDIIVHGIPSARPFENGDIVGIDIGMYYKGYHTDASWSVIVGSNHQKEYSDKQTFLAIGKQALEKAIGQARIGNKIGHISQTIQSIIEISGYSIVRSLVGHGIGKQLHEKPEVPGFLNTALGRTPDIQQDMTLAIEVIYARGQSDVVYDPDGWTIRTADGSYAGLFEHTVLINGKGPVILT